MSNTTYSHIEHAAHVRFSAAHRRARTVPAPDGLRHLLAVSLHLMSHLDESSGALSVWGKAAGGVVMDGEKHEA